MLEDEANGAAPVADAASPVATEAPAEPSVRSTMEAVYAKYPDRGADGRYASRFPDQQAEQPEAPPATEATDQPETPQPETANEPSIEPPASWSADVKAKWSTLPPDLRAYIAQREGEAHKAITSAGEKAKAYDALDAVIGPRRQAFAASFGSEAAAIKQLLDLSDFASRDPQGFVQWFAQQHRVDLTPQSPTAHAASADPQVVALQRELETLKSHLTQREAQQLDADIRSFAEAKDASGAPMRPHFQEVRAEMGRLLSAGVATTLEDAYAKAIRTNDAVWAKVQAAEAEARAKAEVERQAKAKAEAEARAKEAARRAQVNVRTTGSVSGSPAKPATPRETMEAAYRRAMSAA